jgi:hypothetical protein
MNQQLSRAGRKRVFGTPILARRMDIPVKVNYFRFADNSETMFVATGRRLPHHFIPRVSTRESFRVDILPIQ